MSTVPDPPPLMMTGLPNGPRPFPNYPPGSDELTAQNLRRYPELFTREQIDSFIVTEHLGNRGHEDQPSEPLREE